jgi:hypothetical protein
MVDFFGYTFSTLYFVFFLQRLKYSPLLIKAISFWVATSIISILWLELEFFPFVKQFVPIIIITFSCYDILYRNKLKIKEIFELYVKISFYVAIFGIFQWLLSTFAGINILIKEPGLLDSITYEPSHYAAVIVPATIYRLYFFRKNKIEGLILVLSLFLTFSLTSYVVLILTLLIPRIKLITIPLVIGVLYISYILLPLAHPRIADRIEAVETTFSTGAYNFPGANGTVVSFASNLDVAIATLRKSPIWGSGLGGHETMYYKYFEGKPFSKSHNFGLNYNSAHSLTIRILSETGLLGFLAFLILLRKKYIQPIKNDRNILMFHVISLACIGHFLSKSLKLGGYIDYGTPFFLTLLIVNYIAYRNYVKSK